MFCCKFKGNEKEDSLKKIAMKKIITLILFPILLLGQVPPTYQNNTVHFQFTTESEFENNMQNQAIPSDYVDGVIEVIVTVELYIEQIDFKGGLHGLRRGFPNDHNLPRHLTSLSLMDPDPSATSSFRLNEQIRSSLAMNDPELPEVDTLVDWLTPRQFKDIHISDIINLPQGFGPSIRL